MKFQRSDLHRIYTLHYTHSYISGQCFKVKIIFVFLTGISKTNNTSEKQLKESKNISNNINSSNSTRVNNNKNVQNTRKSSANENKPQIKNTRKISDEKVPVGSNRKESIRKTTKGIKYFDTLIRDVGSKLIN